MLSRRATLPSSVVLAMALLGCATARPARPEVEERVAVLPMICLTSDCAPVRGGDRTLVRELGRGGRFRVQDPSRTARGVAAAPSGCHDDLACARRLGMGLGVDKLVVVRLARLGATTAVRLSLFDVQRGTQASTVQEVVRADDQVGPTLARLARELGAPPGGLRQEPPLISRWWVWGGSAAIITAGVVGTVILLTASDEGQRPDVIFRPP